MPRHFATAGSFAVVWKAHHNVTGAPAAVKEINTEKLNKKLQESLASEISVLRQARHQNIVGLLDMIKVRARLLPSVSGREPQRGVACRRTTTRVVSHVNRYPPGCL